MEKVLVIATLAFGIALGLGMDLPAYAGVSEGISAIKNGDYTNAFRELSPSAKEGNAESQFILAALYFEGKGAAKDAKLAVSWLRQSADQGFAPAQSAMGECFRKGEGVEKDNKTAAAWYKKAADQGDSDAQNRLGDMYLDGLGVEKDNKTAAAWYMKAAIQDNESSFFSLGKMLQDGTAGSKDYVVAYALFDVLSEDVIMGLMTSDYRDKLAKRMGASQIAAAKTLSSRIKVVGFAKALGERR